MENVKSLVERDSHTIQSVSADEEECVARLDLSMLKDDSEGDKEFETELIQLFIRDAARRLDSLESAIGGAEVKRVHLEAHTVKGICAGIGAHLMQEIAFELEQKGSVGKLTGAEGLLDSLRDEYAIVRQELEEYLVKMS